MIASVYVKDGNIHFYNEGSSISGIGGIAYELGRPLLDFVCYEPERFDEGLSIIASAFGSEFAHAGAKEPEFIAGLKEMMGELQKKEVYLSFYQQMLMGFVFDFIDAPQTAVMRLAEKVRGALERLAWTSEFAWPAASAPYPDKKKHLYRAATDAAALMSEDIRQKQASMTGEIELLLSFRETLGAPQKSPLEYLYWLEQYRMENTGYYFYLENPLRSFYGALPSHEIVQLYEIDTIDDLFRFEFVKMIEHDIFFKKCKNCERFFIPRRRADAEYCERIYADTKRRCSEIGATLRYERKVAENPILEAYSKAYKRFNSRARTKKMTQAEFLNWSEEARRKRDECLAGNLPFEEFIAWLEQGRIRKSRHVRRGGLGNAD
ncbi:MAG: hypothetical protein GX823_01085 [Clostridiales bacterium]|nr:hypothetical protein [Clostridiales bacterium]